MIHPARPFSLAVTTALVLGGANAAFALEPQFSTSALRIFETELAGRPLANFPRFEYVGTFHQGDPISVALDPGTYPSIAGSMADVYLLADRSAAQWAANPTLVDVRGAPTAAVFGASGVASCTVPLAAAGLSGDAGSGFGVPYDLVIDVDRDGQLSARDFIDGRTAVGFYVAKDPTVAGPLAVTEIQYSGGSFLGQDTYYPTNIASLGQLPLVVVSHGNGHDYRWYDHIGFHLASYGCVVVSHQNDTAPGSEAASTTTLTNTNYILANQATIGGGVLAGHIDSHKISFIGHSRGGEGVIRAYNRVFTGAYVPTQFTAADIVFVSSISPVTHLTSAASTPQAVNYHLMYSSSDTDVTGSPGSTTSKPFVFYERATGNRSVSYVQGAGHADFHAGGGSCVCTGPSLIGFAATHQVVRGYYLPLIKLYTEGNPAAKDYISRMYGSFHAPGIAANVIVATEYRDADTTARFVLDDFQTNPALGVSSSGGLVGFNVSNLVEGLMQDTDGSFDFSAAVPHNGMTNWKDAGDSARCAVFDWTIGQSAFYEFELLSTQRDLRDDRWLSLRAAQGTRHPETDGLDAPLTFTVTLRDGQGVTSSIAMSNYGALTRTYKRTSSGVGTGWANEWNSMRVRLADFASDMSPLDLSDIAAVRLEFGAGFGSARGRIGLDDLEIIKE